MRIAAVIAASLAALISLMFAGLAHCVARGSKRRHWYCIACLLWGKRS